MSIAIISLTEQGRALSERIAAALPDAGRFCFHKYTDAGAEAFTDLSVLTERLFSSCRALIFVCACGIAVRMIAPHLADKTTDPAVLVMDGGGRFVIPLLSGHIGGANALARTLSAALGAQAIITTGTDTGGVFSPDSFAVANGLHVTDLQAAKEIAAAALNGETIGLVSDYPYENLPPELSAQGAHRTGLYIGTQDKSPFPVTLQLVPRSLVLGIGCKRGTPEETIAQAVYAAGLPIERLCAVATIDRKAQEPGLLAFCKTHRLPLYTYTAGALMEVEGTFSASHFVQETTGADNVCERSAVKCSSGTLVLRKKAMNGVTVAAAERPVLLDFERPLALDRS